MMLLVTLPVWVHVTFGDLCCSTSAGTSSSQLIGPIQFHVKRQNSSICKVFQDIAWTVFCLWVAGSVIHLLKCETATYLVNLVFSAFSVLEGQSKIQGNPTGVIRYLNSVLGSRWQNSIFLHQPDKHRPMLSHIHILSRIKHPLTP